MEKKLNNYISYAAAIGLIILMSFIIFRTEKKAVTPEAQPPVAEEENKEQKKEEDKEVTDKSNLIRVTKPTPGNELSSPLEISGEARGTWYFEASFPIVLVDNSGQELGSTIATAQGEWMTKNFVPFKAILNFDARGAKEGKLIFKKDNPSDMRELDDSLEIPAKFAPAETTTVKVFFGNENDVDLCSEMYPRERTITQTQAVGKRAIEELLSGPTQEEKDSGYFTSINPDVKLQKITIQNGTAYVDFDEQLERAVGGSCRVLAIRSQITETLKQFPTVKNVVISINGRTEDILQP